MLRLMVMRLLLLASLLLTGCGDDSGCSNFNPKSRPLAAGASEQVTVTVVDGALAGTLDVNGGYYAHPMVTVEVPGGGTMASPSPRIGSRPEQRQGVVRLDEQGVVLDLGEQQFVVDGPLGCD